MLQLTSPRKFNYKIKQHNPPLTFFVKTIGITQKIFAQWFVLQIFQPCYDKVFRNKSLVRLKYPSKEVFKK